MNRFFLVLALLIACGIAGAQTPPASTPTPAPASTPPAPPPSPFKVGDAAPDFTLPYATRDSISDEPLQLSTAVGKTILVLAFYPADWSGGCTREVCALRDNFTALGALNADVIGISGDYVNSHYEWAKHHELPFRLASDHDHAVAKTYGVFNPATGYDRRSVYAIDKQGKIAYFDLAYSVRDSVSFGKLRDALQHMN